MTCDWDDGTAGCFVGEGATGPLGQWTCPGCRCGGLAPLVQVGVCPGCWHSAYMVAPEKLPARGGSVVGAMAEDGW